MSTKRTIKVRICKCCGKEFTTRKTGQYCSQECLDEWNWRSKPNVKKTLCWDCKKATAGDDCPWANEFKPVEGWKATRTSIGQHYRRKYKPSQEIESFVVHYCPLFEKG